MVKKKYVKPVVQGVEVQQTNIICGSGGAAKSISNFEEFVFEDLDDGDDDM